MNTSTRRKFIELLMLSGIFSIPVLSRVWATNPSEKVSISWKVPASEKDTVKDKLTSFGFDVKDIKPDNVKSPLVYVLLGPIILTQLCKAISWFLCHTSPGILIYPDGEGFKIVTDPNLFKGMAIIYKKDGTTETIECSDSQDSSELYKKVYEKLLK